MSLHVIWEMSNWVMPVHQAAAAFIAVSMALKTAPVPASPPSSQVLSPPLALRFKHLEYSRLDRLREFGRSKKLKLLDLAAHAAASLTLHAIAWHLHLVP